MFLCRGPPRVCSARADRPLALATLAFRPSWQRRSGGTSADPSARDEDHQKVWPRRVACVVFGLWAVPPCVPGPSHSGQLSGKRPQPLVRRRRRVEDIGNSLAVVCLLGGKLHSDGTAAAYLCGCSKCATHMLGQSLNEPTYRIATLRAMSQPAKQADTVDLSGSTWFE